MYHSILVPLDGSAFAEQALPIAVSIAKSSGAKLTLVRAWDPSSYRFSSELTPPFLDTENHDRTIATAYLDTVVSRFRSADALGLDSAVVAGRAADAIIECRTQVGADLIVMTTHGRTGWSRAWLGSVADAVVRTDATPVLLCRPVDGPSTPRSAPFARVLVPLDGSGAAEQILPHVAQIGRTGVASFILLRVVQPVVAPVHPYTYKGAPAWETEDPARTKEAVSHARDHLDATREWLKARCSGATVDVDVRVDERVGWAIVNTAREQEADLVALTTHARRGVRLVIGSVADKVLRGTEGAVLVLRPTAD